MEKNEKLSAVERLKNGIRNKEVLDPAWAWQQKPPMMGNAQTSQNTRNEQKTQEAQKARVDQKDEKEKKTFSEAHEDYRAKEEKARKLKRDNHFKEKALRIGGIVLAALFLLILLQFAAFYGMFCFIETKVRVLTGLDVIIVKGFVFLIMAGLLGTSFCGLVWSFLPFPQKNKKRNRFIFLSVIAAFFFLSYFVSQGVYFNPEDGTPLKYYSFTNGEYNFSSTAGFDPVTGDELKPVTKEVVINYKKSQAFLRQENANNLANENRNRELKSVFSVLLMILAIPVLFILYGSQRSNN